MTTVFAKLRPPKTRERRPKQIARRSDVARATFTVIARHGLEGASMRAIANEMACTTGVLTHHFRDKFDLIKFVLDSLLEQLVQQMVDTAEMKGANPLPGMMLALLPHDEDSELRWRVLTAFTVASMNEPSMRTDQTERETLIHDWYVHILTDLQSRHKVRADIDVVAEAELLSCFIDGLASKSLLFPERYSRKRQKLLVNKYVKSLSVTAGSS